MELGLESNCIYLEREKMIPVLFQNGGGLGGSVAWICDGVAAGAVFKIVSVENLRRLCREIFVGEEDFLHTFQDRRRLCRAVVFSKPSTRHASTFIAPSSCMSAPQHPHEVLECQCQKILLLRGRK